MKVRMKGTVSGTRDGKDWPKPGEMLDVPDDEGAQLCAAGLAEAVKSAPKPVETAAVVEEKAETATPVTTDNGPVKRGPGRPRKNS